MRSFGGKTAGGINNSLQRTLVTRKQKKSIMASEEEEQRPEGAVDGVESSTMKDPEQGKSQQPSDTRALKSLRKGESEVEVMATKIEQQRADRIPVTKKVRQDFLKTCRRIAESEDCPNSMIPERCLLAYHEEVKAMVDDRMQAAGHFRKFCTYLGFLDDKATLLQVLDRALIRVNDTDDDFFHYQDFNFYNTKLVSRWPFLRNPIAVAVTIMLLFYIGTPVWFCHIVPDGDVCPSDPEGSRSYYGWLTSLYFASTTMSTVGYGDVTVLKDTRGYVFVGIAYMIISLLVAVTAFSAAAENAFSGFSNLNERLLSWATNKLLKGDFLHQQIRRLKFIKLMDILIQFTLLNVIGMVLARFFVRSMAEWTWMTTFYWAVQTTTTIGYGDLDMPFEFRWFQILYLTIGTYFVGGAFGKLASLKQELEETRRLYAWQRRIVSKGMIMDMNQNDDVVDQYEFIVASLLSLGKISSADIEPVMDRFRTLAGEKGYIQISDQDQEDEFEMAEDADGIKLKLTLPAEGGNGGNDPVGDAGGP